MQMKCINDYGFHCETNGSWIRSLLSTLEKPLSSNVCFLRQVSRCISQCRKDEEDNKEVERNLQFMHLIICIAGRYFDQKDLKD